MDKKPIMTIREARRFLGKDSIKLNDVEVMEIVKNMQLMAKQYIHESVKKPDNKLGSDDGLPESKP